MKAAGLLLLFLELVSGRTPDYARDIAPIIQHSCIPCHRPGGGGPFPLITYEDVRRHASQIAAVTRSRYMPPWLPDAPEGTFLEERRLPVFQIQAIADWVAAKAPSGDLTRLASPQLTLPADDWLLGPPDLILKAARPLIMNASGADVFWNFLFPVPLRTRRFVRAIEIHPDKDRLMHHANLLVDRTGASLRLDSKEGNGFPGMDLNISRSPLNPESHFLFWKPGSRPYAEQNGFSWQLNPGNLLVLNTHLQPSGKTEEVTPSIGIYFTDQPPTAFPILVELQNDRALNIPAGTHDFAVEDQLTLPSNCRLLAIYPHAHYLGALLHASATLPNGTHRELIRIPHWDLNQQAVYRFREPVYLPKGTLIAMRFHYDNSASNVRNPHSPPQRVHAGNAAADEMAHLWLQLLPEGKGDHRRPIQEAVIRRHIQREPDDADGHLNLAALLLSKLDAPGSLSELRLAIRLDPRRAEAYDMLGAALQNTGQLQAAIEQFRRSLQLQPDYMSAHYNLALALVKTGRLSEAATHLETVVRAYPGDRRIQSEYQVLRSRLKLRGQ